MKRIVNGVTYNTDTSTRLAESRWEHHDEKRFGTLYQTRGGAFFVDLEITKPVWNESEGTHQEQVEHSFVPKSPEEAQKWILTGEVEVFANPFDDPPEAEAEAEPGATIYIRVPVALKRQVDAAAGAQKVSGNTWAMRCVERCLKRPTLNDAPELARMIRFAQLFEGGVFRMNNAKIDPMADIAREAADLAKRLGMNTAESEIALALLGDDRWDELNRVYSRAP